MAWDSDVDWRQTETVLENKKYYFQSKMNDFWFLADRT